MSDTEDIRRMRPLPFATADTVARMTHAGLGGVPVGLSALVVSAEIGTLNLGVDPLYVGITHDRALFAST